MEGFQEYTLTSKKLDNTICSTDTHTFHLFNHCLLGKAIQIQVKTFLEIYLK